MNRLINFYKRVGKGSKTVTGMLKMEPIFKGVPVPFKQTPGRAQFYYTEAYHLIPESILYQIRMPSKYAEGVESTKYNDEVEAEVLKYFEQKVAHNLFDPRGGLSLDLTVDQARQLTRAHDSQFGKVESGELQTLLDSYNTSKANKEEFQDLLETKIDEVLDNTKDYLKEVHTQYKSASFAKTNSITYYIPVVGKGSFSRMVDDVNAALQADSADAEATAVYESLTHIAEAHVSVAKAKLAMQDPDSYETYDQA